MHAGGRAGQEHTDFVPRHSLKNSVWQGSACIGILPASFLGILKRKRRPCLLPPIPFRIPRAKKIIRMETCGRGSGRQRAVLRALRGFRAFRRDRGVRHWFASPHARRAAIQAFAPRKFRFVDPRGVEPRPTPCHGVVLPLYYGPSSAE